MRNADMSSLLAGSLSPHLEVVARHLLDDVPEETVDRSRQLVSGPALVRDNLEFIGPPRSRASRTSEFAVRTAPTPSSIVEILNDDMPFLVDSVLGEIRDRGIERCSLVLHPIFMVKRSAGGDLEAIAADRRDRHRRPAARESLSSRSSSIRSPTPTRRHSSGRSPTCSREVRLAVTDWKADAGAPRPGDRDAEGLAAAGFRSRPARGRRLPRMDRRRQFHAARHARTGDRRAPTAAAVSKPRTDKSLGVLRNPDVRVLRRAGEPIGDDAEDPRILPAAGPAHHLQGERAVAGPPAHQHGLRRRQVVRARRRRHRRTADRRAVHLWRLHAVGSRRSRCCARRSIA